MAFSPQKVFSCGIASGASTSSYMDLGGVGWARLAVYAVTMSTGAAITVYGGVSATGSYYPILERSRSTSSIQYNSFTIATATSGSWCLFSEVPPFQYIQFVASAVVSGGVSITALAS